MNWPRPVLACAAVTAAAHALFLWGHAAPPRGAGRDAPRTDALTHIELVAPPTEISTSRDAASADAMPRDTAPTAAPPLRAAESVPAQLAPDHHAPTFAEGSAPRIGVPDAPMPEGGGALRAYVEVDEDGVPSELYLGTAPGTTALHALFNTWTRQGLLEARLERAHATGSGAYCLQVEFEPGAPAPQLRWLVGAAGSTARCLTGPATVVRDLGRAAPP